MMRIDPRVQRAVIKALLKQPWLSARQLAEIAGCAPGTAHKLRLIVEAAILKHEELGRLDDAELAMRLFGSPKPVADRQVEPDWMSIHSQMQQPDATLSEIWLIWKETDPRGWSYGHFAKKYRHWLKKQDLTMRQVHRAGEKTFVDFAGGRLTIHLPDGSTRDAQLFVGVLGASNYTFATLVWTQGIADWIECHNGMAAYFGGMTQYIVPDNLKSAVIRAGLKQLVLNETYRAWAEHHGAIVLPAKVYRPRYKAKAEVGVQIAQRIILYRLRRQRWQSLEEANAAVAKLLEMLNTRPFKKMDGCRKQRYEQLDRPMLRPLPGHGFEHFELVLRRLVPSSYHVDYEQHFYSVPYAFAHRRVDLRVTARMVEVLHGGRRICSHERCFLRDGLATTCIEHLPDAHRHTHNGEPAELRIWAERVGPATFGLVGHWLSPGSHFHRGLVAARGLRQEADFHDEARIESACRYAERVQVRTLGRIRSILRFSLDQRSAAIATTRSVGTHENVRGPDYYDDKKEVA